MNTPPRAVTLRFRDERTTPEATLRADLGTDAVERMLQEAERHGLPRHPDTSIAALLAAARFRSDVPPQLYNALAAVLSRIYAATERSR